MARCMLSTVDSMLTTTPLRKPALGARPTRTVFVTTGCFAWALLHKEHGIVLPTLLLAAELCFAGRGFAESADGARTRWMLARALVLLTVAYIIVRLSILGGFAGDAPQLVEPR